MKIVLALVMRLICVHVTSSEQTWDVMESTYVQCGVQWSLQQVVSGQSGERFAAAYRVYTH